MAQPLKHRQFDSAHRDVEVVKSEGKKRVNDTWQSIETFEVDKKMVFVFTYVNC